MAIQSGFNIFLPREVELQIFSYLPFKSVVQANYVSKSWKEVSEDSSIWHPFYKLLFEDSKDQGNKALVSQEVTSLKTLIANDSMDSTGAHVRLSRLGLSSLQSAYACVKNLNQNEKAELAYRVLGFEYIKQNLLGQAEKVLKKMSSKYAFTKGILAYNIVEKYLGLNKLDKALCVMQHMKDNRQIERDRAFSLFIEAVIKGNNINFGFKAIVSYEDFDIHGACVRQFAEFLTQKEIERFKELNYFYPEAIREKWNVNDVKYYIYTNQIKKAEEVACILTEISDKISALQEIKCFYNQLGNKYEDARIGYLISSY